MDARAAGEGNLEILVQTGTQSLPTEVEALGNAIFGVSFTPMETILEESSVLSVGSSNRLSCSNNLNSVPQPSVSSSSATIVQPHLIYVTFNDDNVPGNNVKQFISFSLSLHFNLQEPFFHPKKSSRDFQSS